MPECLRYARGQSSLGNFLAAVSDRGLVAFEFTNDCAAVLEELKQRISAIALAEDRDGLFDLIHQLTDVVDHPWRDPGIPLDVRGSDYQKRVWSLLRNIRAGETTTYGSLAAQLGTRDAREVTAAIASNGIAILIPCHRVVKKNGSLSGYRWGFARKRALLKRERDAIPEALPPMARLLA